MHLTSNYPKISKTFTANTAISSSFQRLLKQQEQTAVLSKRRRNKVRISTLSISSSSSSNADDECDDACANSLLSSSYKMHMKMHSRPNHQYRMESSSIQILGIDHSLKMQNNLGTTTSTIISNSIANLLLSTTSFWMFPLLNDAVAMDDIIKSRTEDMTSKIVANNDIMILSNEMIIIVFIIGIIPFIIATYEFWRRIAFQQPFGTTSDSVIFSTTAMTTNVTTSTAAMIGEDNNPLSSRGQRILDPSALYVAYVLFAIAGSILVLVIYSVISTGI